MLVILMGVNIHKVLKGFIRSAYLGFRKHLAKYMNNRKSQTSLSTIHLAHNDEDRSAPIVVENAKKMNH